MKFLKPSSFMQEKGVSILPTRTEPEEAENFPIITIYESQWNKIYRIVHGRAVFKL